MRVLNVSGSRAPTQSPPPGPGKSAARPMPSTRMCPRAHLMVGGIVRFPPGMLERGVCESQVCPAVSFPQLKGRPVITPSPSGGGLGWGFDYVGKTPLPASPRWGEENIYFRPQVAYTQTRGSLPQLLNAPCVHLFLIFKREYSLPHDLSPPWYGY
jgi:hypothetical protein